MTAMTAASLDLLSEGRFRLGLGVSGPQVSEGWHGVRFDRPLARTREFVEIVKLALARSTVALRGPHLPAAAARRSRQGAQAHHRSPRRPDPDLPGGRRAEEPRAGRGDRRRLAGGVLRARVRRRTARSRRRRSDHGRPATRRLRRGGHHPARRGGGSAGLRRPGPLVRRPLRRRDGQSRQELLQPAGGPDGVRGGGRHDPGPLPVAATAGRDGGGAVRADRLHLAARARRSGSPSGWPSSPRPA